ncbi:hypothetical protein [Novosphingobium aquimarinum]|uniref:hypothetical protein n=1 Tax=Novosphingobium aquimarinum TaxID=2682494 RepID=UPI0012EB1B4F|nr:hypothetical protein [Novosphingobium aquimarinum]
MRAASRIAAIAVPALLLTGCAAQARLSDLETVLASRDSATLALEDWCARRALANPATIRAVPITQPDTPLPVDGRALLAASADEPIAYRHVALACGDTVLSVAHNWYRPDKLTDAMNRELANGQSSFGKVVAPLGYRRERLESAPGAGAGCPADTVLTHRALLRLPDGAPLALLVECYTEANLRADPT